MRSPDSVTMAGWPRSTTGRTDIGPPGRGYGYLWRTYTDGSFATRHLGRASSSRAALYRAGKSR